MHPKVSLIFPVYGQKKLLLHALTSLKNVTRYRNYEVILVDDGSRENMDDVYEQHELYDHLLRLKENTGNSTFVVNEGVKVSSGELIQYQNTDVYFEDPDWLDKLITCFDEDTAVVGPALLYPDKSIQSAGMFFDRAGLNHHLYRYQLYKTVKKKTIEVPMITGCGLTTRRDIYNKLGGFRVFRPHGWDDADWCLRVKRAGYKIKLCLDSYFYHIGTVSYSGCDTAQYRSNRKKLCKEHRSLLKEISGFTLAERKWIFFLRDLENTEANVKLLESIRKRNLPATADLMAVARVEGQLRDAFREAGFRIVPFFSPNGAGLLRKAADLFSFLQTEKPAAVVYQASFFDRFSLIWSLSRLLMRATLFSEQSEMEKIPTEN